MMKARGEAESPSCNSFEDHSLPLFPSGGKTSLNVSCVTLSIVTWLMMFSKLSKEPCHADESVQLEQPNPLSSKTQ